MNKTARGFTLLELLIVVAIIGILAVLITPNVVEKIQHGRQVGTMSDINTIAKACLEHVAMYDEAPAAGVQDGPLTPSNAFIKAIQNRISNVPTTDHWGNPLMVYTGPSVANYPGFTADITSSTDFLIVSYGRDKKSDGFAFNPDDREAGLYRSDTMEDFKKDLANWNGTWIRAPRGGSSSGAPEEK